jgi:hypothetical protein
MAPSSAAVSSGPHGALKSSNLSTILPGKSATFWDHAAPQIDNSPRFAQVAHSFAPTSGIVLKAGIERTSGPTAARSPDPNFGFVAERAMLYPGRQEAAMDAQWVAKCPS